MSPILEVLTSNFSKLEDLPTALYYALRNSYGLTKEDLQDLLKVKLTKKSHPEGQLFDLLLMKY